MNRIAPVGQSDDFTGLHLRGTHRRADFIYSVFDGPTIVSRIKVVREWHQHVAFIT